VNAPDDPPSPPVIRPWNTATVRALAARICTARAVDLLPILADALQDDGYADEGVLARARCTDPVPTYRDAVVLVASALEAGDLAGAVHTIDTIAADLGDDYGYDEEDDDAEPVRVMDFALLVAAADRWLDAAESGDGPDYEYQHGSSRWRDSFGRTEAATFWAAYTFITGRACAEPVSFFSCSC
jgi:hypothetical protein